MSSQKSHLIIVPGHSILKTHEPLASTTPFTTSDEWHLESFQHEGSDHLIFLKQISHAVELYSQVKEESVIMFSGGQTKAAAGEVSEAESYLHVLKTLNELNNNQNDITIKTINDTTKLKFKPLTSEELSNDILLEEYARDSFENVLFSLSLFKHKYGTFPSFLTIIGFEFKRARFERLHLQSALNWPLDSLEYVGFDPVPPYERRSTEWIKYFDDLKASEFKNAYRVFEEDLLGKGEVLKKKRKARDPFGRSVPQLYKDSSPEFEGLFADE